MHYILFYKTVDKYIEKRAPYRDAHLAYAQRACDKGNLIMGGALTDPTDSALLLFRSDGPEVVEEFAKNDPYVKNELITEWHVRPWNVVIGKI